MGRGPFGSVSVYGVEGGFALGDFPSPRSDADEEKLDGVIRWREGFSGLGRPLPSAESGPTDSRVRDRRERTRGSDMPESLLSRAAVANAKRPPFKGCGR